MLTNTLLTPDIVIRKIPDPQKHLVYNSVHIVCKLIQIMQLRFKVINHVKHSFSANHLAILRQPYMQLQVLPVACFRLQNQGSTRANSVEFAPPASDDLVHYSLLRKQSGSPSSHSFASKANTNTPMSKPNLRSSGHYGPALHASLRIRQCITGAWGFN